MARPKKPPPHEMVRLHYINEWAERRGMSQIEIADSMGIDKGTVSKWFAGALPSPANLPRIAGLFGIDLDELFREPSDNWMRRLFERHAAIAAQLKDRDDKDLERVEEMLRLMFGGPKTGTDG